MPSPGQCGNAWGKGRETRFRKGPRPVSTDRRQPPVHAPEFGWYIVNGIQIHSKGISNCVDRYPKPMNRCAAAGPCHDWRQGHDGRTAAYAGQSSRKRRAQWRGRRWSSNHWLRQSPSSYLPRAAVSLRSPPGVASRSSRTNNCRRPHSVSTGWPPSGPEFPNQNPGNSRGIRDSSVPCRNSGPRFARLMEPAYANGPETTKVSSRSGEVEMTFTGVPTSCSILAMKFRAFPGRSSTDLIEDTRPLQPGRHS